MSSNTLVSVVVPAYNAEATIDETLRSVRAQTHAALEILVVDDGSRDATLAMAERHAAQDSRIRIVRQANAGVAAARNTGWSQAKADLIAFVDADDLWAPDKIARQLAVMEARGPGVGLVYGWSAKIDAKGCITDEREQPLIEGNVLARLCRGNFIGNGSSALVRRQALIDAGGFEPGLRAAGAQGCEDILFYARVAERHAFALVPDHLTGYRYLPGNMSSDLVRMLRSWTLVMDEIGGRHPELAGDLRAGLRSYGLWLAMRALAIGKPVHFVRAFGLLARRDRALAAGVLARDLPTALAKLAGRHARRSIARWRRGRMRCRARLFLPEAGR
ncbi:MAG: glycosyltransferase family 2 protein [Alphaproteobacteria bacterium]|nr:glycosyltransferase family 2 protein [Alphaproteobacteria bacterium]